MRVVMMGTGLFAEPTFERLLASFHSVVGLITQPDRAVGAERGSTRQTGKGMKNIALERGVSVFQPESINTLEGVAGLKAMQPDLLVVAAYGQILAREVLEAAPRGGINVHASLLPKYRGAAPIQWAIWRGEKQTGVTIIRMTTGLDAGEILAQDTVDIQPDETAGELEARLAPRGADLALDIIDRLAIGPVQGRQQDKSLVTKAPKMTKEHGAIDWTRTAEEVCNHIRAMQPWPTAYTFLHRTGQPNLRLIVVKATPRPRLPEEAQLTPGLVVRHDDATLLSIIASAGIVEITDLQPAGKRRMTAGEFLRSRKPQAGDFVDGNPA